MKTNLILLTLILNLKYYIFYLQLTNNSVQGYKPVVIVHGIFDHKNSLFALRDRIEEKHLGTNVTIVDKLHRWKSMAPMWYQVKVFRQFIQPIMEENPEGIHILGFSQGGLIARGVIQSTNKHNVKTFVSLSSPQGGQFGDEFLRLLYPGYVKETAWRLFYRKTGQLVSVGNYWRDPHHLQAFYNHSVFLPVIDNEVSNQVTNQFKWNFLKLEKLVLIGGPDDGIITPWQSSQFGCYDEDEYVVEMIDRDIYTKNTFGLRNLNKEGKIEKFSIPGVKHLEWHKNLTVIDNYILPFLD